MVWTKHEFEREVRRQLVELESIRKRVPANADVLERIDRLEESHRYLLRKLTECFQSAPPKRKRCGKPSPHGGSAHTPVLPILQWQLSGSRSCGVRTHVKRAVLEKRKSEPGLGECCASCGKVLLSSLLAGEAVVFFKKAWHHKGCAEGGKRYGRPGMLN